MIRRRRRTREIAFGFDSFLDVVANVVGIIIRLILVAWVGARSYSSLQTKPKPTEPVAETNAEKSEPEDPLQRELAEHRRELAEAQARLLDKLRELQVIQEDQAQTQRELAALSVLRQRLDQERAAIDRTGASQGPARQAVALSLAEIRQRKQRLLEEIRALEKLPPARQALRYRTPVSRPLQAEELFFECRRGRIAFIDIAALLGEIGQAFRDKKDDLRTRWEVSDIAGPVGAFQVRYVVERQREPFGSLIGAAPDPNANFSYGVSRWEVEPVVAERGETAEAALALGSQFRQVVDRLDPLHTAVTLWVYPDSFEVFRRLRDYLYERDFQVAGRPLPDGMPIAGSRHGSISRGQ
jgi:hypothetical protein